MEIKEIEQKAREVWKKHEKEIKKATTDLNEKKPLFSFLEGPPTANAPPGLHHLEVRTYKDTINKFRHMQGFSVPRKGGWDCHGLPVEVQVEKALGLNSKKDIEKYGVAEFIEKARSSVFSNIKDWEESTRNLNYWIDLEKPYITLDNDYIESVWWSLKELYKKDLLYEGHKVVPFCPRCSTPLSSHEVAQGYKDVSDESIYIAFKLKNKKNEYVLAWTTTPWTLPGNVALAVGTKIKYVKIKLPDGDFLIVGKDRLNVIDLKYEIVEEFLGKKLEGIEYEPLYDIKETQNENSHKIILADFVTTEDGTGVVHTAVMYGEDDYNVGTAKGLPAVHTVGQDGKFLPIVEQFQGKFVKSAEKDIIEDLKKRHILFKKEKILHSYPFCWRCDTPLLYYAINSWFVKVSSIKDRMVELNQEINWNPEHIKDGRFGKWLEGAKDWAVSRFKFWGTPLPIWKCECGKQKIIGSVEELKKESIKKIGSGRIDLHKPFIDTVKIKCSCGKEMNRVSDVIDCWYDSGSASFAQFHYPFENKEIFNKRLPYDFISEAIDQTRGWFYTLHVLSTALFDKPAFKNVICAGHVVDEKGEKMSKSRGNIIVPNTLIEKAGVDAVRLQFFTADEGSQKRYSLELMKETAIPFVRFLYNLHNYYLQLPEKKTKMQIEDEWILSRLNTTIKEVTQDLENYTLSRPFERIYNFVVNDFSKSYVKLVRDREDTKEIVGKVLKNTALIVAPFAPYISEYIYQTFDKNSVHLSSWPKSDSKRINKELEQEFKNVFESIEKGLAERDKQAIGLRWPLAKAEIKCKEKIRKEFEELIKSQLNVKKIECKKSDSVQVEFDTKITPELEAEGYARELSRQAQAFRKELGLVKDETIELYVISDDKIQETLEKQADFIKKRVNAEKLGFIGSNDKERFKNRIDFKIKEKKGELAIVKKVKPAKK